MSGDQFGVSGCDSRAGAVLYCWDGGAAHTASSEKADGSPATKVNHFYNGLGNAISNRSIGRYRGALATGAEAQARDSNNNNPAKPNCGAPTARFHASRMTSGSLFVG